MFYAKDDVVSYFVSDFGCYFFPSVYLKFKKVFFFLFRGWENTQW